MTVRLDKLVAERTGLTRSAVAKMIRKGRVAVAFEVLRDAASKVAEDAPLTVDGEARTVKGEGGGPISAFMHALATDPIVGSAELGLDVVDYAEHAVSVGIASGGADATAAAYVEVRSDDGTVCWGVGLHESILTASMRAVVSAVNRHIEGCR